MGGKKIREVFDGKKYIKGFQGRKEVLQIKATIFFLDRKF